MEQSIVETTGKELVEAKPVMLAPLSPEEAKKGMQMYQAYVEALLDKKTDYQKIGDKEFKKKSAWRKLAFAANLSVRVVDERREELPDKDFAYHFVCEATHPNGRVTSGSGSCTAMEKGRVNTLHNVRSTAETRAWNRAVSNMIGAGEVSAEEADQEQHAEQYSKPAKATVATTATPTATYGDRQYTCPTCKNNASVVEGTSKAGKHYKGLKCSSDRTHFWFDSSDVYKQVVEDEPGIEYQYP